MTLLARSGVLSTGLTDPIPDDTPICPAAVNRWANQRLALMRRQLEQQHGFAPGPGTNSNAIGAALDWIDARIIDQRIGEARQKIRLKALTSSRCLVQFDP